MGTEQSPRKENSQFLHGTGREPSTPHGHLHSEIPHPTEVEDTTGARLLITLAINLVVLLLFGVIPSWPIILTPLFMLPLFALASAVGMQVCVIKVVAPDVQRAVSFLMGLLMYVTPVIYSPKVENEALRAVIKWNPLTYLVGGMRDAIIYGRLDHPEGKGSLCPARPPIADHRRQQDATMLRPVEVTQSLIRDDAP